MLIKKRGGPGDRLLLFLWNGGPPDNVGVMKCSSFKRMHFPRLWIRLDGLSGGISDTIRRDKRNENLFF